MPGQWLRPHSKQSLQLSYALTLPRHCTVPPSVIRPHLNARSRRSCCRLQVAAHYWSGDGWAVRSRASAAVRILDSGQLTVGEVLRAPEVVLAIERSRTPAPDAASEPVGVPSAGMQQDVSELMRRPYLLRVAVSVDDAPHA